MRHIYQPISFPHTIGEPHPSHFVIGKLNHGKQKRRWLARLIELDKRTLEESKEGDKRKGKERRGEVERKKTKRLAPSRLFDWQKR